MVASNLRHRRSSESVQSYIQDNKTEIVQERQRGDAFGELALMYNVPRQATVTCVSDYATLWALPRQVYRDVTQLEALDSIQSIVETLQSVASRHGGPRSKNSLGGGRSSNMSSKGVARENMAYKCSHQSSSDAP